jgi:hypothetical protein
MERHLEVSTSLHARMYYSMERIEHSENQSAWYPFDDGATVGTQGSERGTIIRDEEHPAGARITLERGGVNAPFAIMCGIHGRMVHTVFARTERESLTTYEAMKIRLAVIALSDDGDGEDLHAFTDEFP